MSEKQYEDRPGDVALFKVRDKKNPRGPDYTGYHITLDGKRMRVAVWERNGGVLSGKIEEDRQPPPNSGQSRDRRDEIPF